MFEVKMELDFSDLKNQCWCEAVDFLEKVEDLGYEDELMNYLEECFCYEDIPSITTINDYLRFEADEWLEEQVGSDSPNDYYKIIDFCKAFYKSYSVIQAENEEEVETFLNDHFDTISEAVEAMQDYSIHDWEKFKADYE